MPKSRPPNRSKPQPAAMPEVPPGRADVERAIEAVLERLKPRPARKARHDPASRSEPGKPARKERGGHLSLVPGDAG